MATQPPTPTGRAPRNHQAVPSSKYEKKQFDNEKYNVESYSYPSDLIGPKTQEYGSNYVIFYINVNDESKMLQNTSEVGTVNIDASERLKSDLTGRTVSNAEMMGVQTAAGAAAGTAVGAILGSEGGAARGGVAGGVIGAAGSAAISSQRNGPNFSRQMKRLDTAIALHVPNSLSIRYSVGWSDEEMFAMNAALAIGDAGAAAVERFVSSGGKTPMTEKEDEAKIRPVMSAIANAALKASPMANAAQLLSGLAPNPMKEQLFRGVDFRTFTFEYMFAPRDETEAENVRHIIKAFKYHMHPEYKNENNFLFLYPSEFDIVYFHGTDENLNINRHTSCVLTEMSVNYTPNGQFTTFKGGMPTQINVQLTFKELMIVTKELVQDWL